MAQAAAQAQQAAGQGPAVAPPVSSPTPVASAAPSPQPAPAQTVTAVTPPKTKKRAKKGLVLVLLAVGLGVGATQAPASWRNAAGEQFNKLMGQLQFLIPSSAPPLSDAEKSLLLGGPVPAAAEELGRPVRDGKATPEQVLAYQNALVYGSGRAIRRLSVIAPADQKVAATLAAWQRSNWNEASREGTLLVISLENVESDWAGATRRALGKERFREGRPADAVLVYPPAQRPNGWAGWFEESPPLFWVGARDKNDPTSAKTLPALETNYSELLHQMQLTDEIWLAKDPPAPSGSKHENFGGPDTVVKLLKQNPKPLLVVDGEQLKTVENWPKITGARLLTIAPAGGLSAQPPAVPAGYRLYALSQATPYAADPTVAAFFQTPEMNAAMFDALARVGSHMLGETRQTGLTWHSDRNGELEPARFSLLEARNGQWVWLREGGGK